MASQPLRLKVQQASRSHSAAAPNLPVARVWVETGVSHLEAVYDYLVPLELDDQISVGVRVLVDFSGKKVDGYVIERVEATTVGNLKYIEKPLSPLPLLNTETISLISAVSRRWASTPQDLLSVAVPPRVISAEKGRSFTPQSTSRENKTQPSHSYYQFIPGEDPFTVMASWVASRRAIGGVLVILPELKEVHSLASALESVGITFALLDSSLTRGQRYSHFLDIASGEVDVAIGTRSAVFAPVRNLQTIIVFREGSQSHYEVRNPGWNTREVAILRSRLASIDLTFAGFSPSSEIALMLEDQMFVRKGKSAKVEATAYPQAHGELLPDRIFAPIRKALEKGSVLFLVPRKGYSQAISCRSCRNIALCTCGGRISFGGPDRGYACSLCDKRSQSWSCSWCKKSEPYLLGRGNIRYAQEIGRAFPGLPVFSSDAENPIQDIEVPHALVLATAGMAPRIPGGYQAVVITDGDTLFSQIDLRSHERAREAIFQTTSLLSPQGKSLLVIDGSHPIVAALSRWNLGPLLTRELRERDQTQLPPYVHAISMEFEGSDASSFNSGIEAARTDGRVPPSTRVLGPTKIDGNRSRVVLTVSRHDGQLLIDFVGTYRKKRGASKKSIPAMRVDPYDLTHI